MNNDLILLDTNIIIYALKNDPNIYSFVNKKRLAVSFVTEIELLGWKRITASDKTLLNEFLKQCLYIDYNYQIRRRTISIKSSYNLKLADAFIAASSLEFDIPLVSADKIFEKVTELNFIHLLPFT
ncbi:MAG: type II toxin-antitoxin system VapC family toxin [Segetibacter sp.]|nr:type II toxin-antitoxin system VapC family toxin [Segetibacter sp.]